ncbi:hypothetical protein [Metabacillus fastidiosus]|uniref:hypothetical protein n=1 Tax=Metabacillus fastidiosus TaxID=1458 RepID=UPI000825A59F|nr:hypothetical protein [Metabacillus fastidiosus]
MDLGQEEKGNIIEALERVLMAKILLTRRGVYPVANEYYYTFEPYSNGLFYSILSMINLGTGWKTEIVEEENSSDIIKAIITIPELKEIFELCSRFTPKQEAYFDNLLEKNLGTFFSDYDMSEIHLMACTNGTVRIQSEYLYEGLYGFLEQMLDLQDELQLFVEEIRNMKAEDGVA